ncbi:aTP-dependent DNA helicase PcrA [Mycoplasma sp. CAG:472]|nr:aTP-dependent DNA helicase PcrA [Mycoplasma sp. CAG:472]
MDYIEKLNNEQKKAATFKDGPCLVIAGAGSGKTKVLTTRIANLIENGVKPYNILAITFTNKAAGEMRERVNNIINAHDAFIGTFHSFGLKIIRENSALFNLTSAFTLIDTEDQTSIIKKIMKDINITDKMISPAFIKSKISFIKNNMLSDSEIANFLISENEKIAVKIYYEYEKILKRNNTLDFDDLLKKPVELFNSNKEVLEKYQDKFKYILIDEYQDTNEVQYKLVKLLSKKYLNLFVVGDPSQSIYAFRGANYQNILNFEKDFKGCTVIKLPQNYRSTQTILDAANEVISHNKQRKDLDLFSDLGQGVKIKYIRTFNDSMENKRVVDEIQKLYEEGYNRKDMAIFYRTNAQSRSIEDALVKANIPYKVFGSFYFYKRKEIKDLLAYLKLIANPSDDVSLERVINEPKRKIGDKTIENLREKARSLNISMFEAIDSGKELEFKNLILNLIEISKDTSITGLIDKTLELSKMKETYENDKSLESDIRLENLMEFRSVSETYENETGNVNLSDFLMEVSLVSDAAEYSLDSDAVTLMTVHSAKGLEFKVVFIIGLEENIMPISKALYDDEELEEERRLMYVAITRAKEKLYLLNAGRRMLYGNMQMNPPSRFISEISDNLLDKEETKNEMHSLKTKLLYSDDNTSGEEFKNGDIVTHLTFGKGVVVSVDDKFITIAFHQRFGVKKFLKNYKGIRKVK